MNFAKYVIPIIAALSQPVLTPLSDAATEKTAPEKKSISVLAEQFAPERMALFKQKAEENMRCDAVPDDQLEQQYKALSQAKWNLSKMGCGVHYGSQLADQGLFNFLDIEQQLTILGSHAEYFDAIHKSYPSFYVTPEVTLELDMRWAKNTADGQRIISRLEPYWWWLSEFKLLSTAFQLASTQHLTEFKESIAQSQSALVVLNEALAETPEALDSLAPLMTGQLLLSLPEFNGGDPVRAIQVLQQGIELSPDNLAIHRWLVDAYAAEREHQQAIAALENAALVAVRKQHPQDSVDILKDLSGFALSLNQKDLARHFQYQRTLIHKQHPYLNMRVEEASMGHGGPDPITGKWADELH